MLRLQWVWGLHAHSQVVNMFRLVGEGVGGFTDVKQGRKCTAEDVGKGPAPGRRHRVLHAHTKLCASKTQWTDRRREDIPIPKGRGWEKRQGDRS